MADSAVAVLYELIRCQPTAESADTADVEKLARRAIRFRGIPFDRPAKADNRRDQLREFADGQVCAAADVNDRAGVVGIHQEATACREVAT
jgi:hypothetical protein